MCLPDGHRTELLGRWSTNGISVDEKMSGHVKFSTARGRPKSLWVMLMHEVLTILTILPFLLFFFSSFISISGYENYEMLLEQSFMSIVFHEILEMHEMDCLANTH